MFGDWPGCPDFIWPRTPFLSIQLPKEWKGVLCSLHSIIYSYLGEHMLLAFTVVVRMGLGTCEKPLADPPLAEWTPHPESGTSAQIDRYPDSGILATCVGSNCKAFYACHALLERDSGGGKLTPGGVRKPLQGVSITNIPPIGGNLVATHRVRQKLVPGGPVNRLSRVVSNLNRKCAPGEFYKVGHNRKTQPVVWIA